MRSYKLYTQFIHFAIYAGYGVSADEIYASVVLLWKAVALEGFNYALVAEIGGKFAGFYIVFDHHQGIYNLHRCIL